jgi:hypothetical protein
LKSEVQLLIHIHSGLGLLVRHVAFLWPPPCTGHVMLAHGKFRATRKSLSACCDAPAGMVWHGSAMQ